MARCSDCGNRCSCVIKAGANVNVSGAGTNRNPYIIEAEGGAGGTGWSPGDIKMSGVSTAPAGWLVANGQAVSRNTYAALFAAIGETYGAGDGAMTFNVPDLAGRFPLGADGTHAMGAQGGAETAALTMANIPAHTHTIAHTHDASHAHTASSGNVNLDHGHHFVVGGGGHEHLYAANVNRNNYQSGGSFGAAYSEFTAGTGGGGGHTHEGDTWGVAGGLNHAHSVTVDTASFSTGAPSTPNSGSTGAAVPASFGIMPPWVGVTFLIKT